MRRYFLRLTGLLLLLGGASVQAQTAQTAQPASGKKAAVAPETREAAKPQMSPAEKEAWYKAHPGVQQQPVALMPPAVTPENDPAPSAETKSAAPASVDYLNSLSPEKKAYVLAHPDDYLIGADGSVRGATKAPVVQEPVGLKKAPQAETPAPVNMEVKSNYTPQIDDSQIPAAYKEAVDFSNPAVRERVESDILSGKTAPVSDPGNK